MQVIDDHPGITACAHKAQIALRTVFDAFQPELVIGILFQTVNLYR